MGAGLKGGREYIEYIGIFNANVRAMKPHLGRIALPCVEHGSRMSVSGDVRDFSSEAIFCRGIYWPPQTLRRLYEALYVGSPNAVCDGKRLRGVPADQNQGVPPDERSWSKERGRRAIVCCERGRNVIRELVWRWSRFLTSNGNCVNTYRYEVGDHPR